MRAIILAAILSGVQDRRELPRTADLSRLPAVVECSAVQSPAQVRVARLLGDHSYGRTAQGILFQ